VFLNVFKHNYTYMGEKLFRFTKHPELARTIGKTMPERMLPTIFWRKRVITENVFLPKLRREVGMTYRRFKPEDSIECSLMILENSRILKEMRGMSDAEFKKSMEQCMPPHIEKMAVEYNFRLVEFDERIVGMVGFYLYGDRYARIVCLGADSGHYRIGVGRFIAMKVLAELKAYGVDEVSAEIGKDSERLFSRYFPQAFRIDREFDNGLKEMALDLTKIKI